MVTGDMPPLALGSVRPRGPFCIPLRMSIKPIDASCDAAAGNSNDRAAIVTLARQPDEPARPIAARTAGS